MGMKHTIFVVNKEPYCIWEADLLEKNQTFLKSIDVDYFDYMLSCHQAGDDDKRAAIALRSAMYHAMETMYSLIGAYVQGPLCAYAWIAKCSNVELRTFVKSVSKQESNIPSVLKLSALNWQNIALAIFDQATGDQDKNEHTASFYAKFWKRVSSEFLDQDCIDENNSIKHGFRVKSGGFRMNVRIQEQPNVQPVKGRVHAFAGSDYGTSFHRVLQANSIKGNRSLISEEKSLNWKLENVVAMIELMSASITNIVSALKIANNIPADECRFLHIESEKETEKPWSHRPDIVVMSMQTGTSGFKIPNFNKDELLNILKT